MHSRSDLKANKHLTAAASHNDLQHELSKRRWVNLVSSNLGRQTGEYLVNHTDALDTVLLRNILLVKNQALLEQIACTELEKFCSQHAAIDLLLLGLKRLNLCLDQLVLALSVVRERVILALSKHDNLFHCLMVSYSFGQEDVEQIGQLVRVARQVFVVLG